MMFFLCFFSFSILASRSTHGRFQRYLMTLIVFSMFLGFSILLGCWLDKNVLSNTVAICCASMITYCIWFEWNSEISFNVMAFLCRCMLAVIALVTCLVTIVSGFDVSDEACKINCIFWLLLISVGFHLAASNGGKQENQQRTTTSELMATVAESSTTGPTCRMCSTSVPNCNWLDCHHAFWCMECYDRWTARGGDARCPYCKKGSWVKKLIYD